MDKKFYNIKYQDPHVGIAVMHTHNPSRCWYACDYHHLHCPNMLIFAKYQDYLTFTQYQTVCWTICETLIPPAILVIRWKRSCCTNSSLFIHTHILLSPPHLHSVAIPMTRVHPTYVGVPAKLLLAQSNNPYIPCTKRSLPWYWHTCDTFICPAYVSMSVKTKLAVVQSRLYLLNINTSTLQHLLYDTSMPPCLQSKCDRYSWFYVVIERSYFLNNQIISARLDTVT